MGGRFFLQQIFPTQGSNPGLLHGRKILETDSNTRSCATVQCIQMDRAEDGHASIPVIPEHKNWQYRSDAVSGSLGFPGDAVGKNPPAIAGNAGLISGSGRSPGAGNDCPLQYSCLENWMDRGAWWATVHGVTKSPNLSKVWLLLFLGKCL